MKSSTRSLTARTRTICFAMAALVSFVMVLPSRAQIITLTDPGSGRCPDQYRQPGGHVQLECRWHQPAHPAMGSGIGSERLARSRASTRSVPRQSPTSVRTRLPFATPMLPSVSCHLFLTGNTASSGINESIRIINNTATDLDFHFFQYSDFNLTGRSGGQSVQLGTPSMASQTSWALSGPPRRLARRRLTTARPLFSTRPLTDLTTASQQLSTTTSARSDRETSPSPSNGIIRLLPVGRDLSALS